MPSPVFISEQGILDLHEDLIEEFGGPQGQDHAKVGSVAAYPQQKFAYDDPTPSIPALAASYGFAACKFHAFVDGNKRVALATMVMFLLQNGFDLTTTEEENIEIILELAAGDIGEEDFTAWVAANCAKL